MEKDRVDSAQILNYSIVNNLLFRFEKITF